MYTRHVGGVLKSEADPVARGQELAKAATDFRDYLAIIGTLPETVAKAEKALKACGTGNATGGSATDQETGDGLGDKANGGKKTTMKADADDSKVGVGDPVRTTR